MTDEVICIVGDSHYKGNQYEKKASLLIQGDAIIINGSIKTVDYVWFYDGVIIKLTDGSSVFPALGDTFSVHV